MANKKLNQLVTKPSIASGDLFPIADATTGQLYKTTISDLGTAIGSGVSSVNGLVGAVVLDTDDIQELASPVNKWFTDLRARAALSAGTGISYSSSTGVIASTITQYTDAMARAAHSLTTTGSNGSATYNSTTGVLNVPTYTLSGLGGQPLATNLTALAGLSYSSLGFIKMTGVGTLALDTNTYYLASNPNNYTANLGTVTSVAALTLGTTGTDLSSSVATGTTTPVITLNVPTASATNRGVLSSADWTTFNGKQAALSGTGFVKISGTTISYDNSTYTLDSAVVHNTGNETIAGQKTFSSTIYGTSAVLSGTIGAGYVSISGASGTNALYITHNSSFNSLVVSQSGTGAAIYATGNVSVIGTGYFSSSLTAASLSSTSGYNYTLPSASGTLALTSNLSSYLPLSGGTLTGALSGTSATFSGGLSSAGVSSVIAKSGSGVESTNLLNLRATGTGAIGDNLNLRFLNTDGVHIANIAGILGGDNVAYGSLAFSTRNYNTDSMVEVIRINNRGNVGIGTTAPSRLLSLGGTAYIDVVLKSTSASGVAGGGTLYFGNSSTDSSGILNYDHGGNYMNFFTAGSERMRITSGGLVGIGTSNPTVGRLQIYGLDGIYTNWLQGSSTSSQSYGMMINAGTNSSDYSLYVRNAAQGSPFIYIRGDGYLYSASAWSGSDRRLKENIIDLDGGLNKILNLKARKFDFINGFKNQYGFIAQELQQIIPDAVSVFDESNQMLAIKQDFIVPHLVKAIQELKAELDTLKNK